MSTSTASCLRRLFRRPGFIRPEAGEAAAFRIDGIAPAPVTPAPDDAELAAQALLELQTARPDSRTAAATASSGDKRTVSYYRALAERIRGTHEKEARSATRYVAYAEQQLALPANADGDEYIGALALLEDGLYKWSDTVSREGGRLKERWQHCVAEITLRQLGHIYETDNA